MSAELLTPRPGVPDRVPPRIVFANSNVRTGDGIYGTDPAGVQRLALEAGYDTVEWQGSHTRAGVLAHAAARDVTDPRRLRLNSLHQTDWTTWYGGSDPTYRHRQPGLPLGLDKLVTLRAFNAAKYMGGVVSAASSMISERDGADWGHRAVPGIFYPHPDMDTDMAIRYAAQAAVDMAVPSDRLAGMLRARTAFDLTSYLENRQYGIWYAANGKEDQYVHKPATPYALSSFALRRRYGRDRAGVISNWDRSLETLGPKAGAVYVDVPKPSLQVKEPHIPAQGELASLVRGKVTGQLEEILAAVQEAGEAEYIVVRAPVSAVVQATQSRERKGIIRDYAAIAETLRLYFTYTVPRR